MKGIEIKIHPTGFNAEQIKAWKEKALKEIDEAIEKNYENPIDDLVRHLENEIDKEADY